MKRSRSKVLLGFLLSVLALSFLSGCASDDEKLSERPWNSPKGWETGLPSGMTDERR